MKTKCLFLFSILTVQTTLGGKLNLYQDSIQVDFTEIENAAEASKDLWNLNLYGPIILVDPSNREILTNFQDTAKTLRKEGEIYTGILPDNVNISNTALEWGGIKWAMIILPLPENKEERLNLVLHELFHSVQPELGFIANNPNNDHLDKKDGRIYLKLELQALKMAVAEYSEKEREKHLTNAFAFRDFRRKLYPGSDTTENLLELNEGIAEFTGVICSGRDEQNIKEHFLKTIEVFFTYPTFVRSFAYQTVPIYGYLLSLQCRYWNMNITGTTDLTYYFIREFGLELPDKIEKDIYTLYKYEEILKEETEREERILKKLAEYRIKFIDNPHLELHFENMSISFDPRNITPLEKHGSVYPNIRVVDNWGILTAEKGALLSPGWDKITVSQPVKIENNAIYGEGWTLMLKKEWEIMKQSDGNYFLIKKEIPQ